MKIGIPFSHKNRSSIFSSQPDRDFYPAIDRDFYFQIAIRIAIENRSGKIAGRFLHTGTWFFRKKGSQRENRDRAGTGNPRSPEGVVDYVLLKSV
ncbi:MAG: hypothetical protein LUO98_00240 [Methanoregula sp.]|nr:hypothetical protein [Methanoregula sp.]